MKARHKQKGTSLSLFSLHKFTGNSFGNTPLFLQGNSVCVHQAQNITKCSEQLRDSARDFTSGMQDV